MYQGIFINSGGPPEEAEEVESENSDFVPQPRSPPPEYFDYIPPSAVVERPNRRNMPDIESAIGGLVGGQGKCKAVLIFTVVFIGAVVAIIFSGLHKIDEGNVGVYYKNGALLEDFSYPGVHYMIPVITDVHQVYIRSETATLNRIISVTKDGIQNTFDDIQVITSVKEKQLYYMLKNYGREFKKALVFDRIKEELKIFCANSTIDEVYNTKFLEIVNSVKLNVMDSIDRLGNGGLELMNLVIPKPDIPNDIAANYKAVKVQWTEQLVATQQQKTETIKKETEKLRAIADAERNKAVLEIKIQEKLLEKEGDKNISDITNDILKKREENLADISKFKILKEAEANKELYTKEFIQYNTARHLANNTKYYFSGQESVLGGVLNKIFTTD